MQVLLLLLLWTKLSLYLLFFIICFNFVAMTKWQRAKHTILYLLFSYQITLSLSTLCWPVWGQVFGQLPMSFYALAAAKRRARCPFHHAWPALGSGGLKRKKESNTHTPMWVCAWDRLRYVIACCYTLFCSNSILCCYYFATENEALFQEKVKKKILSLSLSLIIALSCS